MNTGSEEKGVCLELPLEEGRGEADLGQTTGAGEGLREERQWQKAQGRPGR